MLTSLLALSLAAAPVAAPPPPPVPRLLEIFGTGEAEVPATQAHITAQLEGRSRDLAKAQEHFDSVLRETVSQLTRADVASKDLQVAESHVTQDFDGDNRPVGFVVRRRIVVCVRDLTRTDLILGALTRAKVSSVQSVVFSSEQAADAQARALEAATTNARRKAESVASLLGTRVTRVHRFEEQTVSRRDSLVAAYSTNGGSPQGMRPGALKAESQVHVVFELDPDVK